MANTVIRRIEDIPEDMWYAIQVDEYTDIDNKAILLVYVQYIYQKDVHEDMLCALSISISISILYCPTRGN